MYCLAPSVYAADIMQLEQQLRVMERAGVSCLHVDIMDGSFVPESFLWAGLCKGA